MTFPVYSASGNACYIPAGKKLTKSLRLRKSATAYLSQTPASNGSRTTFTLSMWVKFGDITSATKSLFGTLTTSNYTAFGINASGQGTVSLGIESITGVGTALDREWTNAIFVDPSAWYHIVFVVDTTQAVATDRFNIYVNGVLQSLNRFAPAAQNAQHYINQAGVLEGLGVAYSTAYTLDGYMAEVNFIDGQALAPTAFGAFDTVTGVWQPINYSGTYGTNGFYLPFTVNSTATYAGLFNGTSQYLTVADSPNLELGGGDFCVEFWYNPNTLSGFQFIAGKIANPGAVASWLITKANNAGAINVYASSDNTTNNVLNGATLGTVSPGNYYHIAFYRSGTSIYGSIDGVVTLLTTSGATLNDNPIPVSIGAAADGSDQVSSSISNFRMVIGSSVYSSSNFIPPTNPLTSITNTQLLTLQNSTIVDNSPNAFSITNNGSVTTAIANPFLGANIAADQSGNANNWVPNNISLTTGSTYDSMTDVPTLTSPNIANYAVMNPLISPDAGTTLLTFSNGNLTGASTATGTSRYAFTSIVTGSGKFYIEGSLAGSATPATATSIAVTESISANTTLGGYRSSGGTYGLAGSPTFATYTSGDTIGVAFDTDAKTVAFYKNGVLQGSGQYAYTGTDPVGIRCSIDATTTGIWNMNYGQQPFAYTPPAGFLPLNTYNLACPTIPNGEKYFTPTLYTGNGGTQTVVNTSSTGQSFAPDLFWIKNRSSGAEGQMWNDTVQGLNNQLYSNTVNAQYSNTDQITSFNSNGFTTAGSGTTNGNGAALVAWQWKAGGSAVSNTAGSITSQVSANPMAGFSIVTYTGTGSNATVGHGLGSAPNMVIVKDRTTANSWVVGHSSVNNGSSPWSYWMVLNTTQAQQNNTGIWNATAPTSSVFSIGTTGVTNSGGDNYVAYCWTAIPGFSAFGSYTGNGSANGPFVYTGFRPAFIMVKDITNTGSWVIFDTSRSSYNIANARLLANSSVAEDYAPDFDFLSNGFSCTTAGGASNINGDTFIYAAFAENPFKYANAR